MSWAPRKLAPWERGPILLRGKQYTYEEAEALHMELGQSLARGMRRRGTSTQTPPDGGSTPPMAMVA